MFEKDAHVIDFEKFRGEEDKDYSQSNITTLRLVNPESDQMKFCMLKWRKQLNQNSKRNISITAETIQVKK